MSKIRGFEYVKGFEERAILPDRGTSNSAGYDFYAIDDITLEPMSKQPGVYIIPTGIKAYMLKDEYLQLELRSSLGKQGLLIPNAPGIIDSDYYNNPKNEGHIHCMLINPTDHTIVINKGDHFFQGIFQKYLMADGDVTKKERVGGIGSTND